MIRYLNSYSNLIEKSMMFVDDEIAKGKIIYPYRENILQGYNITDPKVIIVGQDPYYSGKVENGVYVPYATGVGFECGTASKAQSLQFLQWLMCRDSGNESLVPKQPNSLQYLMNQGVMLTTSVLTVEHGKPNSHSMYNYVGVEVSPVWENVTRGVIHSYSYYNRERPIVFMLFGRAANEFSQVVDRNHLVITGAHPARVNKKYYEDFYPFRLANQYLTNYGEKKVQWTIK